ncbi:MAG: hypothetical protein RSG77_16985 [Hafnia sp.]
MKTRVADAARHYHHLIQLVQKQKNGEITRREVCAYLCEITYHSKKTPEIIAYIAALLHVCQVDELGSMAVFMLRSTSIYKGDTWEWGHFRARIYKSYGGISAARCAHALRGLHDTPLNETEKLAMRADFERIRESERQAKSTK